MIVTVGTVDSPNDTAASVLTTFALTGATRPENEFRPTAEE